MGQVVAFVSGKGGTGKTTLCAAVAGSLAKRGSKVLCIDLDVGLRNLDISLLDDIIGKLSRREPLPPKNQDHPLHNNWAGFRECHILPDWLLIYRIFEDKLVLSLTRTGSHSDLF